MRLNNRQQDYLNSTALRSAMQYRQHYADMGLCFTGILLRGDGHGQEGSAGIKGRVRYGHQGGGQNHTHQLIVPYNNTIMEGEIRTTPILLNQALT